MAVDQRRDYVVWSPPGGSVSVRMASQVVDRLNVDVMRGFGVTRRRGTETGGVLLGRVEGSTVWVEDYEDVPCEYAYGPSYLLSEGDLGAFRQAVGRWSSGDGRLTYAVGYYRSHTRDGLKLDGPDVELFERFFGSGTNVVLLIRPFATRTSRASFFVPVGGRLDVAAAVDEFPFTTQVMEEAPASPGEVAEPVAAAPPPVAAAPPPVAVASSAPVEPVVEARKAPADADKILVNVLGPKNHALDDRDKYFDRSAPSFGEYQKPRSRWKRVASWIAFSLALAAFGGAIGYRYAGGVPAVGSAAAPPDPYSALLTVEPQGSNLLVRWSREAPILQSAQRGVLLITEPHGSKEVQLGPAELRNGTVIYQNLSPQITFRLELQLSDSRRFVETAAWRAPAQP